MKQLNLLVVGAGSRTTRVLLPTIVAAAVPLRVHAVVDPDPATVGRVDALVSAGLLPDGVVTCTSVTEALVGGSYRLAIVACPHDQHQAAVLELADAGIAVWKEKPSPRRPRRTARSLR